MKPFPALILCACATFSVSQTANAATLIFVSSFDVDDASGVAFDSETGNLWVTGDSDEDGTVREFTTDGVEVSSFESGIEEMGGIVVFDNMDLGESTLLITESEGGVARVVEFKKNGDELGSFSIDPPSGDPDGIVFDPISGEYIIADDDDSSLYFFDSDGNLLPAKTISTTSIDLNLDEPQGISIEPEFGNLVVANDVDSDGIGRLFEVSRDGELLDFFDTNTPSGFVDPEGVSFDPETNRMFVAFDRDQKIGIFTFEATNPDPMDDDDGPVNPIPLPAGMWFLLGGLGALGVVRRRRP